MNFRLIWISPDPNVHRKTPILFQPSRALQEHPNPCVGHNYSYFVYAVGLFWVGGSTDAIYEGKIASDLLVAHLLEKGLLNFEDGKGDGKERRDDQNTGEDTLEECGHAFLGDDSGGRVHDSRIRLHTFGRL